MIESESVDPAVAAPRERALITGIAPTPGSDRNLRKSGEPENPRCRRAHIDNPTAQEGTTIVDDHNHGTTIALVCHRHLGAERQCAVGGGEREGIQFLTACGPTAAFRE